MGLDKQTAALLNQLNRQAGETEVEEQDVFTARQQSRTLWLELAGDDEVSCQVQNIQVDGANGKIPARLYRPATQSSMALPIMVFLHGGGWSLGDLDCYDRFTGCICDLSGTIIISVDYRLAPEHKYPAGLKDGLAAAKWSFDHADELGANQSYFGIMGDSAGANLATVIARQLHTEGNIRLTAQFLLYPLLDVSSLHSTYPSRMQFGNGDYLLSRQSIDTSVDWYLDSASLPEDPKISPLLVENPGILPPTVILAAGCDPLRDEARIYAERLEAAGVPTHFKCFDGTIHAFLSFGVLDVARQAREYLSQKIREQLNPCISLGSL